jgi:hypothetical protein
VRLALLVLVAGCVNYDEMVHVHVLAPEQVTVLQPTQQGITLSQDGGVVTAHCAWCEFDREHFVVTPWSSVDLIGDTGNVERVGSDLHMRYAYLAPLPCNRHAGLCERPAFTIDVTTPRANIRAIDFERHVSRAHGELTGAKVGLVAGLLAGIVGATMMTYDLGWASHDRVMIGGIAGGFLAIGTFFTLTGARTLAP